MKKAPTIKLSWNDYSQVKERLKMFREEKPRGLIETVPTIKDDGSIMFRARIVADKSDEYSAEATGHSLSTEINAKDKKAFEKLETIAVGRALALLGYSADGEIASSEEMEEYEEWKERKVEDDVNKGIENINNCKSLDELKDVWKKLGKLNTNTRLIEAKESHPLYPKKK